MLNLTKHITTLLKLTLALVLFTISINAQEVRVIDNKGTIHTITPNTTPTYAQVVNSNAITTDNNTNFKTINFGSSPQNIVSGNGHIAIAANGSGITINEGGVYKVTYTVTVDILGNLPSILGLTILNLSLSPSPTTGAIFSLINKGTEIQNSTSYALVTYNGTTKTISFTKLFNFNSGDNISLQFRRHNASYAATIPANSAILIVEKL